ncbi:hypothetical protein [Mesorhizobium sp. B2-5-3]|uniref:hypothetical protein n=1 Tax=Mesorhizobium sp. B2-5-3 TaxID=2589927 RepID=UPI0015E31B57|nr:hypothetical protein [Mesorhizobium sp. B2-5-3]
MTQSFFGFETIYGVDGEHATPFLTRFRAGRLRIHVFHRGDADPDPHDHPWDFWTFPLTSYVEEVATRQRDTCAADAPEPAARYMLSRHVVPSWRWSYRPAEHTHRVIGRWTGNKHVPFADVSDAGPGKIVTIVWQGRSNRKWGFLRNRDGNWCWTPWREYVFGGGKYAPCAPADYDAAKNSAGCYAAAIEAKRLRGDTHYPEHQERAPDPETEREIKRLKRALDRKLREAGRG